MYKAILLIMLSNGRGVPIEYPDPLSHEDCTRQTLMMIAVAARQGVYMPHEQRAMVISMSPVCERINLQPKSPGEGVTGYLSKHPDKELPPVIDWPGPGIGQFTHVSS